MQESKLPTEERRVVEGLPAHDVSDMAQGGCSPNRGTDEAKPKTRGLPAGNCSSITTLKNTLAAAITGNRIE
jgi:hypothetical protein